VILKTQTMNQHLNNEQGMTEIIFAHRNKAYGAYQLRSHYGETTLKSLGYMLLTVTAMMAVAYHFTRPEPPASDNKSSLLLKDSIYVIPFTMEEEKTETIEATETKAAGGAETASSTSTLISDSLAVQQVSSNVVATFSSSTSEILPGGSGSGTGTSDSLSDHQSVAGSSVSLVKNGYEVDQLPRFKGGLKALNDFIRLHVRYPETAVDENRSGTVYVRFIVDENGKVVNAELLNRLGPDLNTEALRVIGMIPDFESPGISKGEPVKTYYQLPISFKLR
jgi:periplasmic protein TonB